MTKIKSALKTLRIEEIVITMLVLSNILYWSSSQKYKDLYVASIKNKETIEQPKIDNKIAEKMNPNYFDKQQANLLSKNVYERSNLLLQQSGYNTKVNSVLFVVEQMPDNQMAKVQDCKVSNDGVNIILTVSPQMIQYPDQQEAEMMIMQSLVPCLQYSTKTTTFI